MERKKPETNQLEVRWKSLPKQAKVSLSPLLLALAGLPAAALGPTAWHHVGGAALTAMGVSILTQINGGEKYKEFLSKLDLKDPKIVDGALGLMINVGFGVPAAVSLFNSGTVDSNALIVYANTLPWLAANGLNLLDGLHNRSNPDNPMPTIRQNAGAVMTFTGAAAVTAFGAINNLPEVTFSGAILMLGDAIRYYQSGATLGDTKEDLAVAFGNMKTHATRAWDGHCQRVGEMDTALGNPIGRLVDLVEASKRTMRGGGI